jgi:hypothetical protein
MKIAQFIESLGISQDQYRTSAGECMYSVNDGRRCVLVLARSEEEAKLKAGQELKDLDLADQLKNLKEGR